MASASETARTRAPRFWTRSTSPSAPSCEERGADRCRGWRRTARTGRLRRGAGWGRTRRPRWRHGGRRRPRGPSGRSSELSVAVVAIPRDDIADNPVTLLACDQLGGPRRAVRTGARAEDGQHHRAEEPRARDEREDALVADADVERGDDERADRVRQPADAVGDAGAQRAAADVEQLGRVGVRQRRVAAFDQVDQEPEDDDEEGLKVRPYSRPQTAMAVPKTTRHHLRSNRSVTCAARKRAQRRADRRQGHVEDRALHAEALLGQQRRRPARVPEEADRLGHPEDREQHASDRGSASAAAAAAGPWSTVRVVLRGRGARARAAVRARRRPAPRSRAGRRRRGRTRRGSRTSAATRPAGGSGRGRASPARPTRTPAATTSR